MPANALFTVDTVTILPHGQKMLQGFVSVGYPAAYDSSNTIFDLSNHLKSTSYPSVIIGSSGGRTFEFSGTAASGRLIAYQIDMTNINGAATNTPLVGTTNNTNIAANAMFLAVGPAY